MFVKTLEELPETMRDQFVASELEGVKGFQHKTTVSLANSMRNAKAERDSYKTKFTDIESRLTGFEASKATEIEAARTEALEKARTSGDVEAVETRYKQQMADFKTRSEAELNGVTDKYNKLLSENKGKQKKLFISDIASEMASDKALKAFKILLESRIDIDPETGKEIYLDENGGATSLDLAGFKLDIQNDDMFGPLLKSGIVTDGGGNVNGGGGGANQTKTFNQYTGAELSDIRKKTPQLYNRLLAESKL